MHTCMQIPGDVAADIPAAPVFAAQRSLAAAAEVAADAKYRSLIWPSRKLSMPPGCIKLVNLKVFQSLHLGWSLGEILHSSSWILFN